MKAEQAMPKDGDVSERASDGVRAIRFDHPWGPYTDEVGVKYSTTYIMWMGNGVSFYNTLDKLEGDDWQPLHPAGDHAAEVKRLTAELATATQTAGQELEWRVQAQLFGDKLQAEVNALTARIKKLEYGIHNVLERAGYETWSKEATRIVAYYWDGGEERAHDIGTVTMGILASLVTAPLPTAGDEGKTVGQKVVERLQDAVDEPDFAGMAARRMIEIAEREGKPGQSTSEAVMDWLGRQIDEIDEDPAEPDSPAEEREGVTLTPGEAATVRDFIGAHSSATLDRLPLPQAALEAALDVFTRLCDEIGEPPKHACEPRDGSEFSIGDKVYIVESRTIWDVHAKQKDGTYLLLAPGINCFESPRKMLHAARAIHHDPTDAAAVELRGRIAEGGGE